MFLALMIAGGILIATVFVVAILRSWGKDVEQTEAELHEPGARTVAFEVPPGRDPAELMAVLRQLAHDVERRVAAAEHRHRGAPGPTARRLPAGRRPGQGAHAARGRLIPQTSRQ